MRPILIIALNTYREIIRDRILYGLFVFAILLIGVSIALGQLSFAEQARISANFGFTAIHLSAVILSIFVGSTLVAREIDKKTILTLLVRPVSRLQFLLGKSLGLSLVILTAITFLAVILCLVFVGVEMPINLLFFKALYGIMLEAILLLGVTVFFSTFCSPFMVVAFTIGLFLIGHWIHSLQFFSEKSASAAFRAMADGIVMIIPDLERFNWRSHFIYGDAISAKELALASGYSFLWFAFLILMTSIIFNRRDLG